jgi:hypothetical protein
MQALAKLFGSPARLKIIRLFVFNQDLPLSPAEVAQRSKLPAGAVRSELTSLLAAGLLRKKGVGTAALYQTNPSFEHLRPLGEFIRDTTIVSPQGMLAMLRKVGALRLVALSGLFVDIEESQIDLLVVGDRLDERALTAAVRSLEAELGREVRYALFSTEDFRYRQGVYDRLIRDVFDYPHRLLVDKIGL